MPKKLRVGVLMGGPSSEREISLITGQAIFKNLDRKKYLPSILEMDKTGKTFLVVGKKKRLVDFQNKDRRRFDIVFIALHGTPGEDGTVQGMFELLDIPYTGPNTLSSALAMNKVFTGEIYLVNKLPHPQFINFKQNGWKNNRADILKDVAEKIGFPAVIKPVNQGSAVGVTIAKTQEEFIKAVDKTIKNFPWLMAQKFIKGQEATCGVLEDKGKYLLLPPTHIKPNLGEFYDFKSKYKAGGSTHICPADFDPEINAKMQDLALSAHLVLGCRGMSRTDMFLAKNGQIWLIETNTIPGMTPTSLFPEAAAKRGIDFSAMLDSIIQASL